MSPWARGGPDASDKKINKRRQRSQVNMFIDAAFPKVTDETRNNFFNLLKLFR